MDDRLVDPSELESLRRAADRGDPGAEARLASLQRQMQLQERYAEAVAGHRGRVAKADDIGQRIRAIRDQVANMDPPEYPYGPKTAEASRFGPQYVGGWFRYAKTPEQWARDARASEFNKRVAAELEGMSYADRQLVPAEIRTALDDSAEPEPSFSAPLAPWSDAGRLLAMPSAIPGYAIASLKGDRQQQYNAYDAAFAGIPSAVRALASPTGASRDTYPAALRAYLDTTGDHAATPFDAAKQVDMHVRRPESYSVPDGFTFATDFFESSPHKFLRDVAPYAAGIATDVFMPVQSYMAAPLRAAGRDAIYGASTPLALRSLLMPSREQLKRADNEAMLGDWYRQQMAPSR